MQESKVLCNKRTFVYNECDEQDDLDEKLSKEINLNKKNPM